MFSFPASLSDTDAAQNLEKLFSGHLAASAFQHQIKHLQRLFADYVSYSPPPWAASGLKLTAEIHYQTELWLPLAEIRPIFEFFYRSALSYPPTLSSTPFTDALSWNSIMAAFPELTDMSANPAALLEHLISDTDLRTGFIFNSFLPRRFYGEFTRYPEQDSHIRNFMAEKKNSNHKLHCLDAACGDGSGCYGLAHALTEQGCGHDSFKIEGWTLDPLEVWAAAHVRLPHNRQRETAFREWVAPLFELGMGSAMQFSQMDLCQPCEVKERFDLITCNGLLGGPIINRKADLESVAVNLVSLLDTGGILLVADNFHGGWKKTVPGSFIKDIFCSCGLIVENTGEGIKGLKY